MKKKKIFEVVWLVGGSYCFGCSWLLNLRASNGACSKLRYVDPNEEEKNPFINTTVAADTMS